jgi:VWFA-related protein
VVHQATTTNLPETQRRSVPRIPGCAFAMGNRLLPACLLLVAIAAAVHPLAAQQRHPASPVHVQPGQLSAPRQAKPRLRAQKPLRVGVNVVRLPVTVRGPHGQLVLDLGPENFDVYDDGALQHITHFDVGGNPMAAVLVVETSSRIAPLLPAVRKTGILFTETVLGATGKGAVIGFDKTAHLVVPFTSKHDRIQKAVTDLKPGNDGAHLYDALTRAIGMLENLPGDRRRVIVAISESADTGSEDRIESILRDAELANISIYTIGLSTTAARVRTPPTQASGPTFGPPGTFSHPGYPGVPQTPSTMQEEGGNVNPLPLVVMLVQMGVHMGERLFSKQALVAASLATGGDHVSTFRDLSIERAMSRFGAEMNAEYTLAYQAPQHGPWGYHQVSVQITKPGYKVRTRPGYFLAPPGGSTRQNP